MHTAFWIAVKKGNPAIIERFLQAGVDVNLRADNSYTPLMQVARDGRDQVVELLLAAGADVNAKRRNITITVPKGLVPKL